MAVTEADLKAFNRFAAEKLANGGAESFSQLVAEWEERQQVNAAIRRGIEDVDAGRTEEFSLLKTSFAKHVDCPRVNELPHRNDQGGQSRPGRVI